MSSAAFNHRTQHSCGIDGPGCCDEWRDVNGNVYASCGNRCTYSTVGVFGRSGVFDMAQSVTERGNGVNEERLVAGMRRQEISIMQSALGSSVIERVYANSGMRLMLLWGTWMTHTHTHGRWHSFVWRAGALRSHHGLSTRLKCTHIVDCIKTCRDS